MAAMFDLPVTPTSDSIHTSLTMLQNPENLGVAVGISLLSSIEAEILRFSICTSGNAAIFELPLTPLSESVHTSTIELLDPKMWM